MPRLEHVRIGDVNIANLEQFKTLNISALPVRYSSKFYKELLDNVPKELIKFAIFNGFAIGSICCRIETTPINKNEENNNSENEEKDNNSSKNKNKTNNRSNSNSSSCSSDEKTRKRMYVMTLSVLPAYRRRGVASILLEHVMKEAEKMGDIDDVYLHVQTSNDSAINFYGAQGFDNKEMIPNYYKRIDPPDCYVLNKSLSSK